MSTDSFVQRIDTLLHQTPTQHLSDQVKLGESLLASREPFVLLFGAGGLGKKTLSGLRSAGVKVTAFVDNNPKIIGQLVEGIPVLSVDEARRTQGAKAVVVITIWRAFATETMQDRIAALNAAGFSRVLPFYYLFWLDALAFPPHYSIATPQSVRQSAEAILSAASLFEDDRSRGEFVDQLRWRLDPESQALQTLDDEAIYFPKALYRPIHDEVYVDCGGFDGDTLADFYRATGGDFEKAFVFEPDPSNFEKLNATAVALLGEGQAKVKMLPYALGSQAEELVFESTGTVSSQLNASGAIRVKCFPLDSVLGGERVTFVKMDIEGSELDAILGAEELISTNRPILAICLYHRQDHLWAIPLKIHSLVSEYDFHLRTYGKDGWDLVLYAIPRERRVHQ